MPRISNFLGQVSDADTDDLPAGAAQQQKNVSTTTAGELRVRGGIRPQTFTATRTISNSAYHTFQKLCYCKTRSGELIAVNGIDRGFRWDGITTTVENLGLTAPAAAPAIARAKIAAADKGGAISAIGDGSDEYRITSNGHDLSDGDKVRIGNVVGSGSMANDLNGKEFTIEGKTTNTFDLSDTTFDGTYTTSPSADGTWSKSEDAADATADGYGATAGSYVFGYRYIDDTATAVPSSMSALTTVQALTTDQFTWSSLSTTTEARAQNKVELWRSTAGVSNVLYKVSTLAYGSIGSGFVDQLDDATLNESAAEDTILILTNPPSDNSLVARRFEPPPNDRPVVVQYQDRYFYLGTVKYNRGTVTTDGDDTIVGSSTDWVATMVGRYIDIDGESKPLQITGFTDATHITLEDDCGTSGGSKSYVIYPEASNSRQVDFSEPDEPESVPVVNVFTVQEQAGDDDDVVGAMPLGSHLFLLGNRHKYAFSFMRRPLRDGTVRYVEDRGAFNHDCWDVYENTAYMMDDTGPYTFSGGSSKPIGTAIKDLWRKDGIGNTIDFAKTASFHVKVDRAKARAYFFVCFTGDSGTQPTRALVYNIRRQSWDIYHYPQKIGAASTVQLSGETRFLLGSESAAIHMADAGNADILSAEVAGTATAGSTTTLTDSAASFATAVVGAPIYIYEGTGKGQIRTITTRNSGTQVTVATWTAPDTTSKYVIGAIEWNWKSTSFGFPQDGVRHERRVGIKFTPTTGDQRIDLRLYFNGNSTVHTFETGQVLGDGVEIQEDNKSDVVFFMKIERSALEDSTGTEAFRFDGTYSRLAHSDHKVAIELRGYAGDDVPKIQQIDVDGVEGKQ